MARLRRSDCSGPGIARVRRGRGFAYHLGNTPAVLRSSYIDPRVFDAYRGGLVILARPR
jgi:DNA topoisomerase IB